MKKSTLFCFILIYGQLQAQQRLFRSSNNYVAPVVVATGGSGVITNGLVLNLDAGNTASYPGTGTAWTDLSGNGNTGTLLNGVGFSAANGGSLVFNGSNNYVSFVNNLNLQITEGTISAWMNATTGNSSFRGIVAKQLAWSLFVYNNNLATYDWGAGALRNTGITVGNNTWNYVSMTFSQTAGSPTNNAIIYLNGVAVLTTTVKNSSQSANFEVGGANTPGQFFTGKIAQVQVYNRVLTPAEVQQNFNATKSRYGL